MLKIIVAKIMIGGEGFTDLSGPAQVKTRSLYEAVKFLIDCAEYVERKVKRKVRNWNEDLDEKRAGRKSK